MHENLNNTAGRPEANAPLALHPVTLGFVGICRHGRLSVEA